MRRREKYLSMEEFPLHLGKIFSGELLIKSESSTPIKDEASLLAEISLIIWPIEFTLHRI